MIGIFQRRFDDAAIIFPAACFVVARRLLGGPIFRGEFVVEDLILLIALASGVASPDLKPLIRHVVACAMGITMVLMALPGTSSPALLIGMVFIGLMSLYAATRAFVEILKLRRHRPHQ